MGKIINHDKFVKNYQLRIDEYCLLPKELRLTYMDTLYRCKVERAKEKGIATGLGFMMEVYHEYFEACGCELINDYEMALHIIKKVSDIDFTPTEENKKLVSEYIKFVAEARWKIYETAVKDYFYDQLANLVKGNSIDPDLSIKGYDAILTEDAFSGLLSEDTIKELIEQELDYCINSREEVEMNAKLDKSYIDGIKDKGYTIEENGNSIIARILK